MLGHPPLGQVSVSSAWHRGLAPAALLACLTWPASPAGQPSDSGAATESPQSPPLSVAVDDPARLSASPVTIDIKPIARDDQIQARLQRVLEATDWFSDARVRVDQGIVFLDGQAHSDELQKWASELARKTQGVVAVVNRMKTPEPSVWDLGPARVGMFGLWRDFIRALPLLAFGALVMAFSFGAAWLATRGAKVLLRERIQARLLRTVVAGATGALVFLVGTYIVLRVSGLTQLALTIVGGTGLIGLAVGIAFRDITENFLASIFLSMQHPFETGDLVEIDGVTGYVQQLNVRVTILMTLDGNVVQIPNATVYKANLRNYTANTNRRDDFVIGIGYEVAIQEAQAIARQVLADHPAVLRDPEPSVLADSLGPSAVNLRVYFWLNGRENSWLKVRSSVIRLVKRAFQQHGISMPDDAREVVFPQGVPVTMVEREPAGEHIAREQPPGDAAGDADAVSTPAEAGLYSEAAVIKNQASRTQPLSPQDNLLGSPSQPGAQQHGPGSTSQA